jgi:hypothetical protein
MGFNHRTPKEILDHLWAHGGDLNHTNFRKIETTSRHLQHCLQEETGWSRASSQSNIATCLRARNIWSVRRFWAINLRMESLASCRQDLCQLPHLHAECLHRL